MASKEDEELTLMWSTCTSSEQRVPFPVGPRNGPYHNPASPESISSDKQELTKAYRG